MRQFKSFGVLLTVVIAVLGVSTLMTVSGAGLSSGGGWSSEMGSMSTQGTWLTLILFTLFGGLGAYLWREVKKLRRRQFELDKLSLVANKTDNAVMIMNQNGVIDWVNDGFFKTSGYNQAEAIGRDAIDVLMGEKPSERVVNLIRDGLRHRKSVSTEINCTSKHGASYWLSMSLTPVLNQQERLVHFVGVGANITARKKAEETLARMSRWYELMLNAMREGICGFDLNGTITFINPAVTRMSGWKVGELIGKPISHLMHQLRVSAMPEAEQDPFIGVAFKDGTVRMGDSDQFRHKDGTTFPVDYNSTPVREADQVVGFVVVFRDVSERKQGELIRARQSRQFALRAEIGFSLATSEGLGGFLEATAKSVLKHLDGALARIWIHNLEEEMLELQASIGLSTRLDGPEGRIPLGTFRVGQIARQRAPHMDNEFAENPNEVDEEWIRQEGLISFVGLPLVVENKAVAVLAIYGRKALPEDTIDVLGAISDYVAQGIVRKQAEEKVAEQAALLDKSQDAILVVDLDNTCQYWNKSAERLYGWPAREVLGKRIDQLIYSRKSDFNRARDEVVERGEWKEESLHVTREGRKVNVESHWTLVQDKKGQPKSILMVNTNITERKEIEFKFLRAQRMESIGTLAGGIAHDLNNILSPILMSVEVLKERFQDEQSHRLLGMVESSAKRGAEMVKQVLTFSRGVESERVLLQTRHLIKEVGRIVNETFPKTIQLRMAVPENLWTMMGDATQLHQVLVNLVVNARDAMAQGGTLTISAENTALQTCPVPNVAHFNPGFYVLIKVADTGTGIPREALEKIFDPFFTTKEAGHGTGLGLSTVIGIIKNHGGFVHVQTEVGRGTEFHVYLPAYETVNRQQIEAEPVKLPTGHGEWILAVDDEASVLTMTKEMLETYGYKVLTARDGTEAIALYTENRSKIKGVLTDMLMPYMDGPTTIRTLKRIDPEVKIIASSGLMDGDKVRDATGLDQIAFLMKPYTAEKLLGAVHEVLNPPAPQRTLGAAAA